MSDDEQRGLLSTAPQSAADADEQRSCFGQSGPRWRELRLLSELAVPLIVQYVAVNAQTTEDLAFVGHLSAVDLAAMNLANALLYATAILPTGISGATRVLTAQSFGSCHNKAEVGVWLHVSTLWTFVFFFVPLNLLWFFGGNIVCAFGLASEELEWLAEEPYEWGEPLGMVSAFSSASLSSFWSLASSSSSPVSMAEPVDPPPLTEAVLCQKATDFSRYSIFWLWPAVLFNLLATALEGLEVVMPQTIISVVFIGVNLLIHWLFVIQLGWGIAGSPIATAVSKVLQLVALTVWVTVVQGQLTPYLVKPSKEIFAQWRLKSFLKLGLPMMLSELLYEWTFEIAIILAASHGLLDVAVLGIVINLVFLLTPFLTGIYIAVSVRVSVLLGRGQVRQTKTAIALAMQLALVASCAGVVVMLVLRELIPNIYTDDDEVIALVVDFMPLAALDFALSSGAYLFQGILEGSGQPHKATLAAVVGSWLIALPLMIWLSGELKTTGIVIAMCVGEAVKLLIMAMFVFLTDFNVAVERVIEMTRKEEEEVESLIRRE